MTRCPYCAEDIQDAAIVCKHCGRDLSPQPPATKPPTKRASPFWFWAILGGIVFAVWLVYANSSASVDLGAAQTAIHNIEVEGVMTERDCTAGTARLSERAWAQLTARLQDNLMGALWKVCSVEARPTKVALFGRLTGRVLATSDGFSVNR